MLDDKTYEVDEFIFLSALNHYLYCPRRCALIHIEQIWNENLFTSEGMIMHEKVDTAKKESRGKVRIEYNMPLRSVKLGLVGKADVVEFHKDGDMWIPVPVEYKRGKPKQDYTDRVQLCAQALCLEEMMAVQIPKGALFYGQTKHRQEVEFDCTLRKKTEDAAKELHSLISSGNTPKPEYSRKCTNCSLVDICLPKISRKASNYLMKMIDEAEK